MSNAAEKFKQLRARAKDAALDNRKEVIKEDRSAKQQTEDQPSSAAKSRAAMELAKLEAEENGEDFERKRAWDWTIEEGEKWDAKLAERANNHAGKAYKDFSSAAERAYLNDRKHFKADLEKYQKNKASGGEQEVDFSSRPSKESIDKLVSHLKKGDENKTKKKRGKSDDNDVNYINDKNKRFNEKLNRHYEKYTKEVKESLERGTNI